MGRTKRNLKPEEKSGEKQSSHPFTKVLLFSMIILAAGILLYAKTISFDYVYCDDNKFVLDYYSFNRDISNVLTSFKKTLGTTFYRPILTISLIIDANISGRDPTAYHRTNVLIHLIASLLVFYTLLRLGNSLAVSCLFSLFFTVHPVLTPAVSWIPGRNDSVVTVFILVSFLFFISFLSSSKWYYLVLHILFFAISLFTKEIAIVFPILCVLFIRLYKKERLITNRNLLLTFSWFATVVFWFFMRAAATANIKNPDTIGLDAFIINYPTMAALTGKLFLPVKMIVLSTFESFSVISGIFFILLLTILILSLKKIDKSIALFGASWFLLFLLPSLLIRIKDVGDFFDYAEHRAYLPLLGLIIIVIVIFRALIIDFRKPVPIALALIIITLFAIRSYSYKDKFQNRKTFWSHRVKLYPHKSRGYLDLGKVYFLKNDLEKAESLYKKGLELNPDNPNLYLDLSAVYLKKKEFKTAEEYAKKALSLDSQNSIAQFYLGESYRFRGQIKKSLLAYEKACEKNDKFPLWFLELGNANYRTGQYEKAIQAYKKALDINPQYSSASSNIGTAFAAQKKFKEAESAWIKAISLNPKHYDAYTNLIKYYMQVNQLDKAKEYVLALRRNGGKLTPDIQKTLETKGLRF